MTRSNRVVSPRWKSVAIGLLIAIVGGIMWNGAKRSPADATKPLMQGAPTVKIANLPKTLKLASFNIHGGKGRDGVRDLGRISELLGDVDFAGLFEIRAYPVSVPSNQATLLGHLQKAAWVFAPTERQWWADHFGNGLLYRIPVHSIVRIPLVNTRGKAFRNAILSTVQLDGADVRVVAVHIDRQNDRQAQLQTISDLFLALQPPCVLIGDLNTTADDPLLVKLRTREGVRSPLHEMTAEGPAVGVIDWIFTRGLKTVSASLVENQASDHPCLKAELVPE